MELNSLLAASEKTELLSHHSKKHPKKVQKTRTKRHQMHVARRQNRLLNFARNDSPTNKQVSLSLVIDSFASKKGEEEREDESNLTRCVLCDDRSSFWFRQLMTVGTSIRSPGIVFVLSKTIIVSWRSNLAAQKPKVVKLTGCNESAITWVFVWVRCFFLEFWARWNVFECFISQF